MTAILIAVSCRIPEPPPEIPEGAEQGAVVGLRSADGSPITSGVGQLGGGDNAAPDAQGFVFYLSLPPGPTQVAFELESAATAHGAPFVQPETLSIWTTVPLSLQGTPVSDPGAAQVLEADGVSVEIAPGIVGVRGEPLNEPYTAGLRALQPGEGDSAPGNLTALLDDDEITPIDVEWVAASRAWDAGGEDVSLLPDARLIVTVDIPEGSGWELDPPRVFAYSPSQTRWQDRGAASLVEGEGQITFEASVFGWWALGRHDTAHACVTGRAVSGGVPVDGAEARLYQEGAVAIDRASTEDGRFCLSGRAGLPFQIGLTGVGRSRSALLTGRVEGTAQGAASCGGACLDLGDIELSRWPDEDLDRAWSGPGGDCDDSDPDVNPNPTLGDGSWCGGSL